MTKSRPTVFVLDGSVAITGAFVSARDMARALRGKADVTLFLPDKASIPATELTNFTAVHRLAIRPLRRNLTAILLYLPHLVLATWQLRRHIAEHPNAVLMVNDFYLIQGPLLRLMGHQGPIFTWVRIDPAAFGRIGWVWLQLSSWLSNRVIAVSRHVQKFLPEQNSIRLLYDPVSAEFLADPLPKPSTGRDFVFLGNYIEGKGQDLALEAFARLLPIVPQARLRFHGGDMGLSNNRAYLHALEARAEKLGISWAVSFGKFSTDPRSVFTNAFAALNLSRSESFSRTVLEACACGLPVIATLSGGPAEIVVHGETGILINVGDAAACTEAMLRLCNDPGLASRMGETGRSLVMAQFAPETFARDLQALISQLD